MLRTGQLLAPSQGRRCSASTAGSRPPPGAALPGTQASPRTGLTPAGCHELLARLRRPPPFSLTPELLDARGVPKLASCLQIADFSARRFALAPPRRFEVAPPVVGFSGLCFIADRAPRCRSGA